jgi:hypothetical protein
VINLSQKTSWVQSLLHENHRAIVVKAQRGDVEKHLRFHYKTKISFRNRSFLYRRAVGLGPVSNTGRGGGCLRPDLGRGSVSGSNPRPVLHQFSVRELVTAISWFLYVQFEFTQPQRKSVASKGRADHSRLMHSVEEFYVKAGSRASSQGSGTS